MLVFEEKTISLLQYTFSHENRKWVTEVFMKNKKKRSRRFDLEKEYGFRLSIHDRDWIAGRTIRANIMDSVEGSRRVIFILSKYFLLLITFLSLPETAERQLIMSPIHVETNKVAPQFNLLSIPFFRSFLKSKWRMEEFMIADAEAVSGRKNFIILVLKDRLKMKELTPELRTYVRTYTYIKATKKTDKLMKKIR